MMRNLVCAGLLAVATLLAGCAEKRVATADPLPQELPSYADLRERGVSARVSVEGRTGELRQRIVPHYDPPPLTPEEQAAVDAGTVKIDDDSAFYRRQRSAKDGIFPYDGGPRAGVMGRAGGLVHVEGRGPLITHAAESRISAGIYPLKRFAASTYAPTDPLAAFTWPFTVRVGIGEKRSRAGVMDYEVR